MRQFVLIIMLLLSVAVPLSAQNRTTEQEIELVPFMVDAFDLQGLRPMDWREQVAGSGVYLRAWDNFDLTSIFQQSRRGTAEEFLTAVQSEMQLETLPEVLETLETEFFTWSLYQFERTLRNQTLNVALAVAVREDRTYYILMQAPEIFFENLQLEVFQPALMVLSPVQRYVDPEARFDVPIPTTWTVEEGESYAVLQDAEASIKIFVSAVEGTDAPAALQAFWEQVYPDFSLSFEPETDVRMIEDPSRIAQLEAVYIVTWQAGEDVDGNLKQGVARVYDGVIYMTLIETTVAEIRPHDSAIAMVDNNFRILALLPEVTPEATQDA